MRCERGLMWGRRETASWMCAPHSSCNNHQSSEILSLQPLWHFYKLFHPIILCLNRSKMFSECRKGACTTACTRLGSQLDSGKIKVPLCKNHDIKTTSIPCQTCCCCFQRMRRICIIPSGRWICLACGHHDGEVLRSNMGERGKKKWRKHINL